MITIKQLKINQTSALHNPLGVDNLNQIVLITLKYL